MKFGTFYEHQLPRPWKEGAELRLFQDALDQVELADRLGIDHMWDVEHHFLEEYAHSSAPEIFLAACSQRTKQIRLGHGIVLLPPDYNHPARVAERIATLDLVSGGRVEFGTGESSAELELGGFNIPRADKRAIGGIEGRSESLGGKIQSFGPVKGVEALLPRHPVGVERAAEIEQHRVDRLHYERPRPATFARFGATPGRSKGSPSMKALHASRATLSRSWRGGLFM